MSEQPLSAASRLLPPGRRWLWLARFLLVAWSLLFSLVAAEIGVRVALPYFSPARQIPFYKNAEGVPLGAPNSQMPVRTPKGDYNVKVQFNRYGFRDDKDLAQSSPDDWFAVGDSFTFGWGLADGQRFSDVAARLLRVPVYNIAIPGDLIDYRHLLSYAEERGAHPRRLIVGVCMENDIMDYTGGHPPTPPAGTPPVKERVRDFLKGHSALYLAISFTLQGKFGGGLMEKIGVARNIDQLTRRNIYSEAALTTSRDALLELTRGREALVLLIPSRALWSGSNREEEARIHERFAGLLREAGQRVVDMRAIFEAAGDPLQFYFKTDPHWNAEGHRVAGEELARQLR